ncbi:hypothetical protein TWF281_001331 [Arthrobotrys megalospora]
MSESNQGGQGSMNGDGGSESHQPSSSDPESQPEVPEPEPDPDPATPRAGSPNPETPPPEPRPDTPVPEPDPDTPRPEPRPESPRPETPRPEPRPESPRPETPRPEPRPDTPHPEPRPDTPIPEPWPDSPVPWPTPFDRASYQSSLRQPIPQRGPRFPTPWNNPFSGQQRPAGDSTDDPSQPPIGTGRPRRGSMVGMGSGSILPPIPIDFTTMPPEITPADRPKYPPGTCHPFYLERQDPRDINKGLEYSRYPWEKLISHAIGVAPFAWFKREFEEAELAELGTVFWAIFNAWEEESEEEQERKRERGPNEIRLGEPMGEGRDRIAAERQAAIMRMAGMMAQNLKGYRSLLANLILKRRRRRQILPYPVDRRWAIERLAIESCKALGEDADRGQKREQVKAERKERESQREISKKKYQTKIKGARGNPKVDTGRSITVQPPEDGKTPTSDSEESAWSDISPSDENAPKSPIVSRPTSPSLRRVPLADLTKKNIGKQNAARSAETESKEVEDDGTDSSSTSSTDSPQGALLADDDGVSDDDSDDVVPNPVPAPAPAPAPQLLQQIKGKRAMPIRESVAYNISEKGKYTNKILEQIRFFEALQEEFPGDGYFPAKIKELSNHRNEVLGVETDDEEQEFGSSIIVRSAREKALLGYGGSIIRDGAGPSTADYRIKLSLEVFGIPVIPPMRSYEFDSPDASEYGDYDDISEPLEVPVLITVTDFDREHSGLEILILPEPTEEHTKPETSITFHRGDDPAKLFARLTVEYHQALANILATRPISLQWTARAKRLDTLIQILKRRIPDYEMNGPLFAGAMGEYAALDMLSSTMGILNNALTLLQQETEKRSRAQTLVYELADHNKLLHSAWEDEFAKRMKVVDFEQVDFLSEEQKILWEHLADPPTGYELGLRQEVSDKSQMLFHEVDNYTEVESEPGMSLARLYPLYNKIGRHSAAMKQFPEYQLGCDPYCYAPDGLFDNTIAESRASLPPPVPKNRYFHPAQVLRGEVKLDALTVIDAMGGMDRNKVRETMLKDQATERERPRLPEEDWEPDVKLRVSVPGRMLESNKFGTFTWRTPRASLEVLEPLVLPPFTTVCEGGAQMNYRKHRELNEKWQFKGWKRYDVWFLSLHAAMGLVLESGGNDSDELPPPPPPPSRRASTATPPVSRRGSTTTPPPQKSPSSTATALLPRAPPSPPPGKRERPTTTMRRRPSATIPPRGEPLNPGRIVSSNDDDDDDGFIEDIEEGTIVPSRSTLMVRQRSSSSTLYGTQPQPTMPSFEELGMQRSSSMGGGGKGIHDDEVDRGGVREMATQTSPSFMAMQGGGLFASPEEARGLFTIPEEGVPRQELGQGGGRSYSLDRDVRREKMKAEVRPTLRVMNPDPSDDEDDEEEEEDASTPSPFILPPERRIRRSGSAIADATRGSSPDWTRSGRFVNPGWLATPSSQIQHTFERFIGNPLVVTPMGDTNTRDNNTRDDDQDEGAGVNEDDEVE